MTRDDHVAGLVVGVPTLARISEVVSKTNEQTNKQTNKHAVLLLLIHNQSARATRETPVALKPSII